MFWVNLTAVQLVGEDGEEGSLPSIRNPGNIAVITILENDNAQGIVQFNVVRVGHKSCSKISIVFSFTEPRKQN